MIFDHDHRTEAPQSGPEAQVTRATCAFIKRVFVSEPKRQKPWATYKSDGPLRDVVRAWLAFNAGQDKTLEISDQIEFQDQPALSKGTGFLIAPDLVLTCRHVVDACFPVVRTHKSDDPLPDYYLAFSFLMKNGEFQSRVHQSAFYEVQEILFMGGRTPMLTDFLDFAVLRLTRQVSGVAPLTLQPQKAQVGQLISAIGYPVGIPAKLSPGVGEFAGISRVEKNYAEVRLDVMQGNSGSPVFDSDNPTEVVAMLEAEPAGVSGTDWRAEIKGNIATALPYLAGPDDEVYALRLDVVKDLMTSGLTLAVQIEFGSTTAGKVELLVGDEVHEIADPGEPGPAIDKWVSLGQRSMLDVSSIGIRLAAAHAQNPGSIKYLQAYLKSSDHRHYPRRYWRLFEITFGSPWPLQDDFTFDFAYWNANKVGRDVDYRITRLDN